MCLFGLGCITDATINSEAGFNEFFWPQAIRGFSLMFCFLPITSLTFATLNTENIQTASGLYNLMRNLGGAIGLAVTNTLLQNWTKRSYLNFRDTIDEAHDSANNALKLIEDNLYSFDYADSLSGAIKTLYHLAQREAYVITFNQVFVAISFLFFASILLMPLVDKVDFNKKNQEH